MMEFTLQQFTAWFFRIVPFALAMIIIWVFNAWQRFKERRAIEQILLVVERIEQRMEER
jgi:hypothetical protein